MVTVLLVLLASVGTGSAQAQDDAAPLAGGDCGCNCCSGGNGVGCDDPQCQATVCGMAPFCCNVTWAPFCNNLAQAHCPGSAISA